MHTSTYKMHTPRIIKKVFLMQLIFHADDYGITVSQSRRILQCCNTNSANANQGSSTSTSICESQQTQQMQHTQHFGLLNSLSMFANSPHFDECADLLENKLKQASTTNTTGNTSSTNSKYLHIGLHINLVEGHCVADPHDVPLLVDKNGMFCLGFIGLLKNSNSKNRAELQRQIEVEIDAQLAKITSRFEQMRNALRIDSHQHTHAIPVVFDALLASIDRSGCNLEYMRIPVERLAPFASPSIFKRIRPVNLAKRALLGHLWKQNIKAHPDVPYVDPTAAFCGVLFSGEMSASNVEASFSRLVADANTRNIDLELLFHPGIVDSPDECLNPTLQGFVDFSTSANRELEAQALKSFELAYQNNLPLLIPKNKQEFI